MHYGMQLTVVVDATSAADAGAQKRALQGQLASPMLAAVLQGYGIRYVASDLAEDPKPALGRWQMTLYVVVEATGVGDATTQQNSLCEQMQNPMLISLLHASGVRYVTARAERPPYLLPPEAVRAAGAR